MREIIIRDYEEKDWERLMEIHDAARKQELKLAGLAGAFVPLQEAAEKEGLFDYTVRVAAADGRAAGFTAYCEGELAWLYVAPEEMRKGIGRRLVLDAIAHTKERPMAAEVLVGNEPAAALYQSCGFRIKETASGVMPGNEKFAVSAYVLEFA